MRKTWASDTEKNMQVKGMRENPGALTDTGVSKGFEENARSDASENRHHRDRHVKWGLRGKTLNRLGTQTPQTQTRQRGLKGKIQNRLGK